MDMSCQCGEVIDLSSGCITLTAPDAQHQYASFVNKSGYLLQVDWHTSRSAAEAVADSEADGRQYAVHIGSAAVGDGLLSPGAVKACCAECEAGGLPTITVCPYNNPPMALFDAPASVGSRAIIPLVSLSRDADGDTLICKWALVSN